MVKVALGQKINLVAIAGILSNVGDVLEAAKLYVKNARDLDQSIKNHSAV